MLSVPLTRRGDDLEVGEPSKQFRMPADVVNLTFTHDGQRALVIVPNRGAVESKLRVILDWTGLVKR